MTAVATEPVPRFYKVKDIAVILGISQRAANRLVKGGDLPAVRCGAALRVSADDLESFVQQRRTGKVGAR